MHIDLTADDIPAEIRPDPNGGERQPAPRRPEPKPAATRPPDKWAWLILDDQGLRIEPMAA